MTDRSRPPLAFDTISFLTDYGLKDEFVGVVKSVIRSITPEVAVIDITHDIEPHDVRAGGLALARSVQYLAPGVVLAVVDPGVGTDRKGIVIEVANGAAYLVGPDNGLLAPAVSIVGGATGAVVLDNPEYQLPPVGSTFDGRGSSPRGPPISAPVCPWMRWAPASTHHSSCRVSFRSAKRPTMERSTPKCCGSTVSATSSSTSIHPMSTAGVRRSRWPEAEWRGRRPGSTRSPTSPPAASG
ncbi:MAG: SAM-dependent chlorinase/fluorinase [Acidimicrobiales bacterium]